jgi:Protein of unknown function (DUF2281)
MTIAETIYEKLKTAPPEVARQVLDFLVLLETQSKSGSIDRKSFDDFYGSLANSKTFQDDPVKLQRQLRDEWDR